MKSHGLPHRFGSLVALLLGYLFLFSTLTAQADPDRVMRFNAKNRIGCLFTLLGPRLAVTQYSCLVAKAYKGRIMAPNLGDIEIVVHPKIAGRSDFEQIPLEYDVAFVVLSENFFSGKFLSIAAPRDPEKLVVSTLDSKEKQLNIPLQDASLEGQAESPISLTATVANLTPEDSGAGLFDEAGHPVGIYLYTGDHTTRDAQTTPVTTEDHRHFFVFESEVGKQLQKQLAKKAPGASRGLSEQNYQLGDLVEKKAYRKLASPSNPYFPVGKTLEELDQPIVEPMESLFNSPQENKSVLIVGQSGTLVDYVFARLAARGDAQDPKRYDLEFNPSSIVAGNSHVGEVDAAYEEKVRGPSQNPNLFIYVRDLNTLIGVGSHEGNKMGIEGTFANDMRTGAIRVIAVIDPLNYNQIRHSDRSYLLDAFAGEIHLPVLSRGTALNIAKRAAGILYPNLQLSHEDLTNLEEFAEFQFPSTQEPDRSLKVLEQLAADQRKRGGDGKINIEHIKKAILEVANAPQWLVDKDYTVLKALKANLARSMSGAATEAREKVVRLAVGNYVTGRGGRKPIASILFAGSTGAGKSFMAKQLAKALNTRLVTFDMTQYQSVEDARQVIRQLSLALDTNPYAIFLFEEIDKASTEVLDHLYFMMDEGVFYDLQQRPHFAGGAFVLMTTNAAEKNVLEYARNGFLEHPSPQSEKKLREDIHDSLYQKFRPSFLNRFDALAVFKPLNRTEALAVTRNLVGVKVREQEHFNNFLIAVDEKALKHIAEVGNIPEYGARSLERMVDTVVNTGISELRLAAGPLPQNQPLKFAITLVNGANGTFKVQYGDQSVEYEVPATAVE